MPADIPLSVVGALSGRPSAGGLSPGMEATQGSAAEPILMASNN